MLPTQGSLWWRSSAEGWCTECSPEFQLFLGATRQQLVNYNWSAIVHPADFPLVFDKWKNAVATGEPFDATYRLARESSYVRVHGHAEPILDDGLIVGWEGVAEPIDTDRKSRLQDASTIDTTVQINTKAQGRVEPAGGGLNAPHFATNGEVMRFAVVLYSNGRLNRFAREFVTQEQARTFSDTFNHLCRGSAHRAEIVPQPIDRAILAASPRSSSA